MTNHHPRTERFGTPAVTTSAAGRLYNRRWPRPPDQPASADTITKANHAQGMPSRTTSSDRTGNSNDAPVVPGIERRRLMDNQTVAIHEKTMTYENHQAAGLHTDAIGSCPTSPEPSPARPPSLKKWLPRDDMGLSDDDETTTILEKPT
jgi:hypothetical protein